MQAVETLIVGQGIAGTCLAWQLWLRGASFLLVDAESLGGSSRVAAGLVNPVTGQSYALGWRYGEFFAVAREFYGRLAGVLGLGGFFHEHAVVRLGAGAERERMLRRLALGGMDFCEVAMPAPWRERAAVEVAGGGRLEVARFLDASREFFRGRGCYQAGVADAAGRVAGVRAARTVFCDGFHGLLGRFAARLPSRCAKGEILTVQIPELDEPRIIAGRSGWLVPLGGRHYRAGSTYQFDELDATPSAAGRETILTTLAGMLDAEVRVTGHVAGVRPIVRESRPVLGPLPDDASQVVFNGLGSKGSLYAPAAAGALAAWLLDGAPIDPQMHIGRFHAA